MLDFLVVEPCADGSPLLVVFKIARWVIRLITIAVPFALIIFGSLDFFKALIAHDEKEMRVKRKPFILRLIIAILIIMLPTFVNIILKTIAKNTNSKFAECWNKVGSSNVDLPDDSSIWNDPTPTDDDTTPTDDDTTTTDEDDNTPSNPDSYDSIQTPSLIDQLKVGDIVRIIRGKNTGYEATVLVINRINGTIEIKYNKVDGTDTVSVQNVVLVSAAPELLIDKLHVNNVVRITSGPGAGKEAIITAIDKTKKTLDVKYSDGTGTATVSVENIEFVSSGEPIILLDSLKVGDIVRITSGQGAGKKGTIASINRVKKTLTVKYEDGTGTATVSVENIEFISSGQSTALIDRIKIGDTIRITSGPGAGHKATVNSINKGKKTLGVRFVDKDETATVSIENIVLLTD